MYRTVHYRYYLQLFMWLSLGFIFLRCQISTVSIDKMENQADTYCFRVSTGSHCLNVTATKRDALFTA